MLKKIKFVYGTKMLIMKTNAILLIFLTLFLTIASISDAQEINETGSKPFNNGKGVQTTYQFFDTVSLNSYTIRLTENYHFLEAKIGNNVSTFTGYQKATDEITGSENLAFIEDGNEQVRDSIFHVEQLNLFIRSLPQSFLNNEQIGLAKEKYSQPESSTYTSQEILNDLEKVFIQSVYINDFQQKEVKLALTEKKLEDIKKEQTIIFSEIKSLENKIMFLKEEKRFPEKLELYPDIEKAFSGIQEILREKSTLEEEIEKRKTNYLYTVSKELSALIESEKNHFKELLKLPENASGESLIEQLKKSIQRIDDREKVLKIVLDTKKRVQQTGDQLKSYNKQGFEQIYKESILVYLGKIDKNEITSLTEFAEYYEKLVQEGTILLASLENVDRLSKSLNDDYKTLNDKYLQLYPPIYKKEVKPLAEIISTSLKMNNLNEKERELKRINDTLIYFQSKLAEFLAADSFIDGHFNQFKEKLYLDDKVLYKMNIPGLESIVKSYKMANMSAAKSVIITEFRNKLTDLEGAYSGLNDQKNQIDSLLPKISKLYQDKFAPIYKSEITQLENQKTEYMKIAQADIRFQAGKVLLDQLQHYEKQYDELDQQSQQVVAGIQEVEVNYTTLFQRIIKDEVGEIKRDYKIYEELDFVDKKMLKGKYILEQAASMMGCIRELEKNDGRIKTELTNMMESFKTDYPLVYKMKIEPMRPMVSEYEVSGYHQRKLTLSRMLIQSLDENLQVLQNIRSQRENIRTSHEEFETYFQSKNQEKNLYKRTKSIYEDLMKEYDKEADPVVKTEKGNKILSILVKINEMRGRDNTKFNEDIKDAKDLLKYLEVLSRY